MLINSVKLTEFGGAALPPNTGKEDERAAALARRAQQGDYDEGQYPHLHGLKVHSDCLRSDRRTTDPYRFFPWT